MRVKFYLLAVMAFVLVAGCSAEKPAEGENKAETATPVAKQAPANATDQEAYEATPEDISYALGMDMANRLAGLPVKLNGQRLADGIMDAVNGNYTMSDSEQQSLVKSFKDQLAKAAENKEAKVEVADADDLSYAIGADMFVGFNGGPYDVRFEYFSEAIRDALDKGRSRMSEDHLKKAMDQLQATVTRKKQLEQMKEAEEQAARFRQEGEAFLAKNKERPEVKTTDSGLQYEVMVEGKGPKPTLEDLVEVRYVGRLYTGKIFDAQYGSGVTDPMSLQNTIPAWREVLPMMPKGSKWRIFVPSELGYGDKQVDDRIPVGSALVFDIELVDFKSKAQLVEQLQQQITKNLTEGAAFLSKNKLKKGVTVMEDTGLQYEVLAKGKGGDSPAPDDVVRAHYRARLVNGTEFYSTYDQNQTVTFQVLDVVPAWAQALKHMKPGDKWRLFSPYKLVMARNTNPREIPPGSTVIFDLELIDILKGKDKDLYLAEKALQEKGFKFVGGVNESSQ